MLHQALLFTIDCLLSEPSVHTDSICEYLVLIICLMGPVSRWQLGVEIFNNTLQRASKGYVECYWCGEHLYIVNE